MESPDVKIHNEMSIDLSPDYEHRDGSFVLLRTKRSLKDSARTWREKAAGTCGRCT